MKRYEVIFDQEAEDDLFEIFAYVALTDTLKRAENLHVALQKRCKQLETLPLRGHAPPELSDLGVAEFREIRYKPYRIIYSVESSRVTVHCILDGRRDMYSLLQERLLR